MDLSKTYQLKGLESKSKGHTQTFVNVVIWQKKVYLSNSSSIREVAPPYDCIVVSDGSAIHDLGFIFWEFFTKFLQYLLIFQSMYLYLISQCHIIGKLIIIESLKNHHVSTHIFGWFCPENPILEFFELRGYKNSLVVSTEFTKYLKFWTIYYLLQGFSFMYNRLNP